VRKVGKEQEGLEIELRISVGLGHGSRLERAAAGRNARPTFMKSGIFQGDAGEAGSGLPLRRMATGRGLPCAGFEPKSSVRLNID
jgi:hypothetical protein